MPFPGLPVAFGQTFERAGDMLLNRAMNDIFNSDADASRLTVVVVYNHTDSPIFFVDSEFDSGNFTPGMQAPAQIDPKTSAAYRVESHGFATGVTGAHIRYGLTPADPTSVVLDITTSNPFAGGNHSEVSPVNGFRLTKRDSEGDSNQVDIDFYAPG
jgi:hypothetical protein